MFNQDDDDQDKSNRQDAMITSYETVFCDRFRRAVWSALSQVFLAWIPAVGIIWVGSVGNGQERLQKQSQGSLQAGDINTEFSRVYIFVDRTTALGHAHGIEGRLLNGNVTIDGSHPGALVFDMKSFDADTPNGRKVFGLADDIDQGTRKKVTENMLGAEVLYVSKYPEAKLENIKLSSTGKTSDRKLPEILMEGDFTLHKTTRKISATCDLEEKNGWNHLRGKFRIRQTDYGIKPYTRALGAVGVKDELLIYGDLWIAPSQ
jgi:hypothetical protein